MKNENSQPSIASAAIPAEVASSFELAMVSIPTPSGTLQATDLFLQKSTSPASPPQTRRFRLPHGVLHSLAHGLSDWTQQLSHQAGTNLVQRTLDQVDVAQVVVHTQSGDQPAFLLTLEQTETGGRKALPSRLVVSPEQLLGLYDLLRETISQHQLARPISPGPTTAQ